MTKIVIIHGGDSFNSYKDYLAYLNSIEPKFTKRSDWKLSAVPKLQEKNFEVLLPNMPNKQNAQYREWKIVFDKIASSLKPSDILIGHSLGGIFLAKYLSEVKLKISELHLIAAPYETCGKFKQVKNFNILSQNCNEIFIWHSKDDFVVDFQDAVKYKSSLPLAKTNFFDAKGHFNQEEFPKLLEHLTGKSKL